MEYEKNFDEVDGFGRIEIIAITTRVIKPYLPPVFHDRSLFPLGQFYHPPDDKTRLTKDAEETTQEAIKEAERIHKKYP